MHACVRLLDCSCVCRHGVADSGGPPRGGAGGAGGGGRERLGGRLRGQALGPGERSGLLPGPRRRQGLRRLHRRRTRI